MITPLRFDQKITPWLGAAVFVCLGILAAVYYLERTLILDASYQTFAMIAYDNFAIQVKRFGAVVTKIFPYIAMKQHWPLDRLLWMYSMGFVVYAATYFLVLSRLLRNERMGMALVLFFTLMTAHTFYWTQSEQLQGSAMTILFFGIVISVRPLPWWLLPVLYGLVVVMAYLHPLTFIPFYFLYLFFLFQPEFRRQWAYHSLALAFLAVMGYKMLTSTNSYDESSIKLVANVVKQIGQFFSWKSNTNFLTFCVKDYYFFFPLLGLIAYHYIKNKEKLKLALFLAFTVGYVILINGTFFWGAEQFYIESYYTTLSIFLAIPLLFDVLPSWKKQQWATAVLAVLIVTRLLHIVYTGKVYERRLQWNRDMLTKSQEYGGTKFIARQADIPMDKLLMTWGSPFETLLLSALQHPDSTRTLLIADPSLPIEDYARDQNKAFVNPFSVIPYSDFHDNGYFRFRDTSHYQILSKEQLVE